LINKDIEVMIEKLTRVLVLGASSMLGSETMRLFAQSSGYRAFRSVRSSVVLRLLPDYLYPNVIAGVDLEKIDSLM
jgi:hypothetical protein